MQIKYFLLFCLFMSRLIANDVYVIKEGENRFSYYIPDTNTENIYYKAGIKSKQMALQPTHYLKIQMDTQGNIMKFKHQWWHIMKR